MFKAILGAAAAAFILSSVGSIPSVANAQPSPATMKKDGEIKNPAAADAAIAKDEAKDAKKKDHLAHRKAKRAAHKAKIAAKKADQAEKAANPPGPSL